jgi:hypothetical protein
LKKYADELDLPLKKREELNLMLERSENIMDSFNDTIDRLSDEKLQSDKKEDIRRRGDSTGFRKIY